MKRTRVYRRGSRLYLHPVSVSEEGAWVMAAPFVRIDAEAPETFLGETLARALSASRSGVRDSTEPRAHLLTLSRTRTWRAFMKGTLVCDVEKDETGVRFFAARNGSRRPLTPEGEHTVALPARAPVADLGAALVMALRAVAPRRRRTPER